MKEPIASSQLVAVLPNGDDIEVTVTIGRPYPAKSGEWRCPVELAGLEARLPDVAGEDALQALCLAISLVHTLLQGVLERGGRLLDRENRDDYPLNAVFGRG